jgi:opacity protein-like surface antigen
MSAKLVLIASAVVLSLAGLAAVFAPQEALTALSVQTTPPVVVLAQLAGVLAIAQAVTNWTAKDSRVGGVYGRAIGLGNFTHWFVGALVLLRYQLAAGEIQPLTAPLVIYALFAALFGWLVFVASGIDQRAS